MSVLKTCGCGQIYDRERWTTLPFVGLQSLEAYGDEPRTLAELRNCGCGSTLSVPLASEERALGLVRRALDEHLRMQDALVAVQRRCSELLEESRRLKTLTSNAFYGKFAVAPDKSEGVHACETWASRFENVREIDYRCAYPAELLRLRRDAWRLGMDQAIAFVEDTARLYHTRPESEGVAGHLDELARLLRSRAVEWGKSI